MSAVTWMQVSRADRRAARLADRHYSRQSPGARQFSPPGRTLVLLTACEQAVWVTSWPFPEYTKHAWPGAWNSSLFRNESSALSSDLIRQAVAVTRFLWQTPAAGMITFVDPAHVRSANAGYCYLCAGFAAIGHTKGGRRVLSLSPNDMPQPAPPANWVLGAVA